MQRFLKSLLLILLMVGFGTTAVNADAPRWVRKGVKSLNAQRSNDTYTFVRLNSHDLDQKYLKEHRGDALITYIDETYAPKYGSIKITEVSSGQHPEFNVTYQDADGHENMIEAMLIDEFMEFDDFDLNVFQFEYYQLYAVSKPNVRPVYDNFGHTTNYNSAALVKSIVPGMGQLDKGQTTKGYFIMGSEIVFVGAGLIMEYQRAYCTRQRDKSPVGWESWDSKRRAWKTFEIGAFCAAGAMYIYNLFDAALSKGASQVTVQKASKPSYQVSPFASTNEVGVSFVMNF